MTDAVEKQLAAKKASEGGLKGVTLRKKDPSVPLSLPLGE